MTNLHQNQRKSNFLKPYKEQALKDIQISIEEWNEFQEKNFFYQIFSKQKRSNHWESSSITSIHLWGDGCLSQNNDNLK